MRGDRRRGPHAGARGLTAATGYTLRPMRRDDADSVAALVRGAFALQPVVTDPPLSGLRVSTAEITAHLAQHGGEVAEAGRVLVGSVLWAEQERGLYTSRVAVAPDWRHRGRAPWLGRAAACPVWHAAGSVLRRHPAWRWDRTWQERPMSPARACQSAAAIAAASPYRRKLVRYSPDAHAVPSR